MPYSPDASRSSGYQPRTRANVNGTQEHAPQPHSSSCTEMTRARKVRRLAGKGLLWSTLFLAVTGGAACATDGNGQVSNTGVRPPAATVTPDTCPIPGVSGSSSVEAGTTNASLLHGANTTRPDVQQNPNVCNIPTTVENLLNIYDPGALLSADPSQLTPDQLAKRLDVEHKIDDAIKNTEFDMLRYVPALNANFTHLRTNPANPVVKINGVVASDSNGINFELQYISAIKLPGVNADGTTSINGKDYWEYAVKKGDQYKVFYVGEDNIAQNADADPSTIRSLNKIVVEYAFDDSAGSPGIVRHTTINRHLEATTAATVGQYTTQDNYHAELLGVFASNNHSILTNGSSDRHMDVGQALIDYLLGKTNKAPACMMTSNTDGAVQLTGISVREIGLNTRVSQLFQDN